MTEQPVTDPGREDDPEEQPDAGFPPESDPTPPPKRESVPLR
jgi:hypothetical protein